MNRSEQHKMKLEIFVVYFMLSICAFSNQEKTSIRETANSKQRRTNHLARKIIKWRSQYRLHTVIVKQNSTLPPADPYTLCEAYDEEGYAAMDDDINRNNAFLRAIDKLSAFSHHQSRWLEIGCGASATLTTLCLSRHPATQVAAVEINPRSAAAARAAIAQLGPAAIARCHIVCGRSTDPAVAAAVASAAGGGKFDVVMAEVIGYFASSEGCVPTFRVCCLVDFSTWRWFC